jgi:hypothetical protein
LYLKFRNLVFIEILIFYLPTVKAVRVGDVNGGVTGGVTGDVIVTVSTLELSLSVSWMKEFSCSRSAS